MPITGPSRRLSRLLIPLLLAGCLTTGCQTSVGNHLANRGRDLGECFRVQVGAAPGIGACVRASGLLHVGLAFGSVSRNAGMGWVYGEGFAFGQGTRDCSLDHAEETGEDRQSCKWHRQTEFVSESEVFYFLYDNYWEGERDPWSRGGSLDRDLRHVCLGALPALLSFGSHGWTWSGGSDQARRARVHIFDLEASVYAGIVYAKAGFSPGEFVDFLLGWVGIDIAGDDRALRQEETPAPESDKSGEEASR